MKLTSTMKAEVLVKSTQKSKDGQTTYYRLTILQDTESGMLSCSEDVYNLVENRKEYVFNTQYNDEYKSFRILGIAAENYSASSSAKQPAATAAATGASK